MALLIYDGDCGFCTQLAKWCRPRFRTSVDVQPAQALDIAAFGLTADDVATAAYWVDDAGRAWRGHLAVVRALRAMRRGWPLLGLLLSAPPFSLPARWAYDWTARNRHRLPGSTDACRIDPQAD